MDDTLMSEIAGAGSRETERGRSRSVTERLYDALPWAKTAATAEYQPVFTDDEGAFDDARAARSQRGRSMSQGAVDPRKARLVELGSMTASSIRPGTTAGPSEAAGSAGSPATPATPISNDVEALFMGSTTKRVWAPEANLDQFFSRMYRYYEEKGFPSIVAGLITNLITLGFTVVFSTFLLGFVDWAPLLSCGNEAGHEACKELSFYLNTDILREPTLMQMLVLAYFALLSGYWLLTLVWAVPAMYGAWRMRSFFRDQLQITTRTLQTMQWHEVVASFDALHRTGQYRVQMRDLTISPHAVASRIMRKDNYIIALVNKDILDLSMPCCFGVQLPFTRSLEWNLRATVLNHMFSRDFRLQSSFSHNVVALQRRFIMFGILNLLFLPFIIMFMAIFFFLSNAEELHKKGDYLGPRTWSRLAQWRMREFNELPHVFERRMNAAVKPAKEYERQFPVPVVTVIAKCAAFVAGSLAAVMLLLALFDEELLLHIHFMDRNLLWYIAVFSGILAVSRSVIPPPEEAVFNPVGTMRKVVAYTHYMPRHWRGRTNTYDVRDEFLTLYQFKVVLFVQELLGALTTPILLLFSFPKMAPRIVHFVKRNTVDDEDLGAVCGYSLFDLTKYGNAKYGAPNHASKLMRSKHGKMEKSLLNFKANNPDWDVPQQGAHLVSALSRFQASQLPPSVAEASMYLHGMPGWGIRSASLPHLPPMAAEEAADEAQQAQATRAQQAQQAQAQQQATMRGAKSSTLLSPSQGSRLGVGAGAGAGAGMADHLVLDMGLGMTASMMSARPELAMAPPQALTTQSLLLPLDMLTPAQQENYFYWLDRMYEANNNGNFTGDADDDD